MPLTNTILPDRLFRYSLLVLFLSALGLCWLGQYTDIDLRLADWMFDFGRGLFPYKDAWWANGLMHEGIKYLLIVFALVLAAILLADVSPSRRRLEPGVRMRLAVVVLAAVLVPLLVGLLKSRSAMHCPWDVDRYGGYAPFLHLFDAVPTGIEAGHCFPAGHATGGLWLAALAVFWLPRQPARAALVFVLGLLPGLAMGWVQQLRGAHFLTHTLWSAWIAAAVVVALARLLPAYNARIFLPQETSAQCTR